MRNPTAFGLAMLLLYAGAMSCGGSPREGAMENASTQPGEAKIRVDIRIGKGLNGESTEVEQPTRKFTTNQPIFATVSIDGQVTGTLRARWLYSEANGQETPVFEETLPLSGMQMVYHFGLLPPAGGLKSGHYKLQLLVNDQLIGLEPITVS